MHEQVGILTRLFLGAFIPWCNEDILVIIHCVSLNVCVCFEMCKAVACDYQSNL